VWIASFPTPHIIRDSFVLGLFSIAIRVSHLVVITAVSELDSFQLSPGCVV
jgi:hypothetical protein